MSRSAALLLVLSCLHAQAPTYRSGVELVEVAVIVQDGDGQFVPGLTADDFVVEDGGARQAIAAFSHVSIPVVPAPAAASAPPAVARDVASNERAGDARVFVLLLDALHVAPQRSLAVRAFARRFVERHVGPDDLVAVVTPGGLEAATQDFTSDKGRLVAAIDQFTGTTLRSAAVEIEEERRLAVLSGILLHEGRDPSDAERVDRARSLNSALDALARHLDRVERRRKSILLFSEGIDYNVGDIMGRVQRNGPAMAELLQRTIGALMRTNVSVYAIDPRALAAAGGDLVETPIHHSGGYAPRVDGTASSLDLSTATIEGEYASSIATLRNLAEATGGFAAVATNDLAGAFDRIVREASDYYVIGYSPSKPGRAGAFRGLRVTVSRPGVRVIARKGYVVPEAARPAVAAAPATAEPETPAFGRARPGARTSPLAGLPSAPATVARGLAPDLQALLASPLPRAGLPIRLQAIPFRGDGDRTVVQLVVEILGRDLAFVERGGRFEEQVDLAMLTIDGRARAGNGRTARLDLRLTPEEAQRVKATGLRWIARLELGPGRHQVRVAGTAAASNLTGLVASDVDVPALASDDDVATSGIVLTSLTSPLSITRGDAPRALPIDGPPSAARAFVTGDRLTAAIEVYVPAGSAEVLVLGGVERADRSRRWPLRRTLAGGTPRGRADAAVFTIDTAALGPGKYVLTLTASRSGDLCGACERRVPFEVIDE